MTLGDLLKRGVSYATRGSPENPSTNLSDPDSWLVDWFTGGSKTVAGVGVSNETAMRLSAYYSCIRILSESVASLPLVLYKRRKDGGRERATDHPLYKILHDEPNPFMSSYVFTETLQAHVAGWGNAYALIVRDGGARVSRLWPMPPNRVIVKVDEASNRLYYETDLVAGGQLNPADVLHIPGLSFDGLSGYNPVRLAREGIGLGLAAEQMAAGLFGRGARPGGILSTEATLDPEQEKRLRSAWNSAQAGIDNAGKTAVLHGGLKYQQISINPKDAQFMETRKFQIAEIARLFRIPLHMLQELDRATFSNIEQQSLEFITLTLRPWLVRWEREINRKLLTEAERKVYFAEFLIDGMLRGDIKTRFTAYQVGIQNGFMSRAQVRLLENWNPELDDGLGEFLVPLNMDTKFPEDDEDEPVKKNPKDADGDGKINEDPDRTLKRRATLIEKAKRILSRATAEDRDLTGIEERLFEHLHNEADQLRRAS